jgi:hypothetical protein
MPGTIIQFAPPGVLLRTREKGNRVSTRPRTKVVRRGANCEPETRLWKVCAKSDFPGQAIIELFVLVLILLVALALIVGCFAELTHLLKTDAIGHVAMKSLQGA